MQSTREAAGPATTSQAFLGVGAAIAVASFGGYESFVYTVPSLGPILAAALSVLAFVVAGALALVAAARFDAAR